MSSSSLKNRRANLIKKDPHCYWCRRTLRFTKTKGGPLPDDFPTIDHLNDRILTKHRIIMPNKEVIVLACPNCNYSRAAKKILQHSIVTMWKAGAFPKPFRWVGTILKIYRGVPLER